MRATVVFVAATALAGCAVVKSQMTLVDGLRQFDAGQHDASMKTLASALKMGLGNKDRATAHKHLAFIHCSAGREAPCREEFKKALAADPTMRLDAAEAGHP